MESEQLARAKTGLVDAARPEETPPTADTGAEARAGASTCVPFLLGSVAPALASVVGLLALLYVLLYVTLSHALDLTAFFLALSAVVALAALIWRMHALYVVLDKQRRAMRGRPARGEPDVLGRLAAEPLWKDPLVCRLLAGAVAANLVIFAYVSAEYAALPPFLPLHYSAMGEVDRLGTPREVFMIPGIGVVVLLTNMLFAGTLYRRERLASYFLVGASIFVQLVLLVATANIVARA